MLLNSPPSSPRWKKWLFPTPGTSQPASFILGPSLVIFSLLIILSRVSSAQPKSEFYSHPLNLLPLKKGRLKLAVSTLTLTHLCNSPLWSRLCWDTRAMTITDPRIWEWKGLGGRKEGWRVFTWPCAACDAAAHGDLWVQCLNLCAECEEAVLVRISPWASLARYLWGSCLFQLWITTALCH